MKRKTITIVLVMLMAITCMAVPSLAMAAENTDTIQNESEQITLAKPTIKVTVIGTTVLKISWTKVANAQKYYLYRCNGTNGSYKKIKTLSASTRSYTNKKLKRGTKYTYRVKATTTVSGVSATSISTKTVKTPKKLTWSTPGFKYTNAYKVMKVAKSKVGNPYVSGGSGPNVFDCSGYAYWVNKKANVSGKKFGRGTAQGEWSATKKYSIGRSYKNAQPGDLVFISSSSSKSNITHVAYYYGNNKLIHATNPRVGVAITSTQWSGGQSKVVDIVRLPNM